MTDTIFAPATAAGRAAVAVVRLSGPGCRAALGALGGSVPSPRRASLRRLKDPASGTPLDDALVLWMPGPASYTGEDSGELQLHGGPAVVGAVTEALGRLGLRLADPGEFTRRAFENGRLDLTQAEAVADLVDAETAVQRDQALGQLDGALTARYAAWRAALVASLAALEAAVDFPDEDLPEALADQVRPALGALRADLEAALVDSDRGRQIRDGFRIALVGAPNAGKSSLLNALAARDLAIVTARPGTTRDVIETPLLFGGFKVVLADTAGLREATDDIEAEGVRRASAWSKAADLRIWVADQSTTDESWKAALSEIGAGDLCLLNKADLPVGGQAASIRQSADAGGLTVLEGSALAPDDATNVRAWLTGEVERRLGGAEFPAATRLRHRARLEEALGHVRRAERAVLSGADLAAEDVRLACRALAQVTGRIDAEQVLDVVFSSFCIGK